MRYWVVWWNNRRTSSTSRCVFYFITKNEITSKGYDREESSKVSFVRAACTHVNMVTAGRLAGAGSACGRACLCNSGRLIFISLYNTFPIFYGNSRLNIYSYYLSFAYDFINSYTEISCD